MDEKVTLLKREAGQDSKGRPLDNWTALPDIWANVRFQSGAEAVRGGAETSIVRVSIRIWARYDVDGDMRIRHLGKDYNIKSAVPDSTDRRFMFLVCESFK
jgi:SPP1 family predicted phage head-tail adaptor